MTQKKEEYAFEISWEVCNKVGGIYTVVKSKAAQMVAHYQERFFMVGPYFSDASLREFVPDAAPEEFKKVFDVLQKEGITAYYGKWLTEGNPQTVLIDFNDYMCNKNKIKTDMWYDFGVDSLNSPEDYDTPVVWADAVGRLLDEFSKQSGRKIIAHAHEWLAGASLLYLKKNKTKAAKIFTTHATVLGRALASNNIDLYAKDSDGYVLAKMDADAMARTYGCAAKHLIEKASANATDIFTTVSSITALETEYLLGRKPEILVPNGLDFSELPNLEDIPVKHKSCLSKIWEFVMSYFLPYYPIEVNDTLIYFLSGRYEFRNKGIDITIKALGNLNENLKKSKSKKNVVVFIFVPAGTKSIKLNVVENKALFEDIQDLVDEHLTELRNNIIKGLAQQELPDKAKIFNETFLTQLKNKTFPIRKKGDPPLCTHELYDEYNDTITRELIANGLQNKKSDRVKVIFYPCYLNSSDRLLDMDYYDVIAGCHLGIFPSYYEPWGYTPLECASYGVPSITTDLAGFGRFVLDNTKEEPGIFVIKRQGLKDDEVIENLSQKLVWFTNLSKQERISCKIKGENFAPTCGWNNLVSNYIKAHEMALEKN